MVISPFSRLHALLQRLIVCMNFLSRDILDIKQFSISLRFEMLHSPLARALDKVRHLPEATKVFIFFLKLIPVLIIL